MYNGMINIYKEKGFTSFDVVAKMRGIMAQKKIGHTGTLDPDAEGVLPVCLGSATKLCDMLTDKEKEYIAVLKLGIETDTQDMTGAVLCTNKVKVTETQVCEIILSFIGDYEQIPPMYSAIKINGQRLYDIARQGKVVERKPRKVSILEIEILDISLPDVTIRVRCSKGTYIRTLCYDIGKNLKCGACMASLKRTKSGMFTSKTAVTLSQLEQIMKEDRVDDILVPVDYVFKELKAATINEGDVKVVENGNRFFKRHLLKSLICSNEEQVRVYDENGRFYGIYQFSESEKCFTPVKMFL